MQLTVIQNENTLLENKTQKDSFSNFQNRNISFKLNSFQTSKVVKSSLCSNMIVDYLEYHCFCFSNIILFFSSLLFLFSRNIMIIANECMYNIQRE